MDRANKAALLLCLTLFCCSLARAGDKQLVAPKPPRAEEAPGLNIHDFNNGKDVVFVRAFYTSLSPAEAVSFYSGEIGGMEAVDQGKHYRAEVLEINIKSLGVLHLYALPRNPGVSVKCIRSLQPRNCTSEYLQPFREMVNSLEKYSRNDYNQVCRKYGYLAYAYYGNSDRTGADGRPLTRDQVLFREYKSELEPEAGERYNIEDMVAEAQKLMAEGRMEEATALFEKIAQAQQQDLSTQMERIQSMERREVADNWDKWIEFLEELDEMIQYPTAVFIDVHPSDWPDDEWLRDNIEW